MHSSPEGTACSLQDMLPILRTHPRFLERHAGREKQSLCSLYDVTNTVAGGSRQLCNLLQTYVEVTVPRESALPGR